MLFIPYIALKYFTHFNLKSNFIDDRMTIEYTANKTQITILSATLTLSKTHRQHNFLAILCYFCFSFFWLIDRSLSQEVLVVKQHQLARGILLTSLKLPSDITWDLYFISTWNLNSQHNPHHISNHVYHLPTINCKNKESMHIKLSLTKITSKYKPIINTTKLYLHIDPPLPIYGIFLWN